MFEKVMYPLIISVFVAVFLVVFACDEDGDDNKSDDNKGDDNKGDDTGGMENGTENDTGTGTGMMGAAPGEFKSDYETSGDFFTLMSGMVEGNSPHGSVQIWYSTNIEDIIGDGSFTAPEGTVSVKPFDEDSDGTLDGYAVMVKMGSDFDPDNNNWHYEMRDAEGALRDDPPPGAIGMCIGCHAAALSTDYLAGTTMTK